MKFHGTTIIALKHKDKVVVAGDGQVTFDQTIIKHGARKVRRLFTTGSSSALPAPRRTPSRSSTASTRSSSSTTETCCGQPWS